MAIAIPQQTLTYRASRNYPIDGGVGANVIIAERIKEEAQRDYDPHRRFIRFDRAFSSILDGNVTVAIAAVCLMVFGTGSMLFFAYSLLVGVILNLICGAFLSHIMTRSLIEFKALRKPWFFNAGGRTQCRGGERMSKINTELLSDPIQTIPLKKFSFYKSRWRFLAISLVLILCGLAFSLIFGITLDIQFRGGSLLSYTISGDIDLLEAERVAESTLNLPVSVQQTTSIQAEGGKQVNALVISVAGNRALSNDQQLQLNDVLGKAFPESRPELLQSTLVDPFIGREVLFNGLLALGIASILIVLYVWIRFRTISAPRPVFFTLVSSA